MTLEEFKKLKEGDQITKKDVETVFTISDSTFNFYSGLLLDLSSDDGQVLFVSEDQHSNWTYVGQGKIKCKLHNIKKYIGFTDIYDYCTKCEYKSVK